MGALRWPATSETSTDRCGVAVLDITYGRAAVAQRSSRDGVSQGIYLSIIMADGMQVNTSVVGIAWNVILANLLGVLYERVYLLVDSRGILPKILSGNRHAEFIDAPCGITAIACADYSCGHCFAGDTNEVLRFLYERVCQPPESTSGAASQIGVRHIS